MNITTRKHPRSLAEAFPDERACAIEHTRRSPLREGVSYLLFVLFVLMALFGFHLIARYA